ncbi:hypothetical protein BaRGS_00022725, partial [Batillaria attramentaria]
HFGDVLSVAHNYAQVNHGTTLKRTVWRMRKISLRLSKYSLSLIVSPNGSNAMQALIHLLSPQPRANGFCRFPLLLIPDKN